MGRRLKLLFVILAIPLALVLLLPMPARAEKQGEQDTYATLQELDGKRIGVQTGSTFDAIVLKSLPNAQLSYFNSYADMTEALLTNKIDGFPADEPVIRMIVSENHELVMLEESMDSFEFGAVFAKTPHGEQLKQEFDEWLSQMQASGELESVISKWTDGPDDEKFMFDYQSLPATNGTLVMATEGAYPPMNYYREGNVVGVDVELAALFCESRGYGLQVDVLNFDGILPAVQSGKADFALAGITITDERKESMYFSIPYYTGGTVMAIRRSAQGGVAAGSEESPSFWDGICESFSKTFLREQRWKLFVEGVTTTLVITIMSILLGTVLGFIVFMLCRNGGSVANGVSGFCMWLLQGMPMVVLLMILYYVIFGSISIGGVVVSVIGFTLTFGTSVFGLLKMGIGAVDDGQREAAFALGYSDTETFFKIILPQALPHIMPAFKGEIVSLIKATSIVGYIAVQDLTKMGDIIRSRTYEAFFPLIAVTIIYFALEGIIGFVANRLQTSIDPKRRNSDRILKGVKTDD